jgi:hypothetical protein
VDYIPSLPVISMTMSKRDLTKAADRLLRANGFRRNGQPRGKGSYQQFVFERKLIRIPMGGKPKR